MRSLLSTERLEDREGRLAVPDVDSNGNRYVKFWVDEAPTSLREESTMPMGDENLSPRVPHVHSAVPPFPSLTMRNGERAPTSEERREGPSQDYASQARGIGPGSPGIWRSMKKNMRGDASSVRRILTIELKLDHRILRESNQKIKYPRDVRYNPSTGHSTIQCQHPRGEVDTLLIEGVRFPVATVDVIQRGCRRSWSHDIPPSTTRC